MLSQVKFAMCGMEQADDFYEGEGGLWHSLLKLQLNLSTEQLTALKRHRALVTQDRQAMAASADLAAEMRRLLQQHIQGMIMLSQHFEAVLEPRALAKFYLWVHNNDWVVHMLNTMFGQVAMTGADGTRGASGESAGGPQGAGGGSLS